MVAEKRTLAEMKMQRRSSRPYAPGKRSCAFRGSRALDDGGTHFPNSEIDEQPHRFIRMPPTRAERTYETTQDALSYGESAGNGNRNFLSWR
jgi:hypothetical protein